MLTKDNTLEELIEGVYKHGPDILPFCSTQDDLSEYVDRVVDEKLNYPIPADLANDENWLIPKDYLELDIEELCLSLCRSEEEVTRVKTELHYYKEYNMLPMLRCMKYIVDTLRANNIVWGVGRGSSVASYCLFLLGVHKIDSIKYDLPLNEFFK